jgi:predicted alpha/beta-fold hydrolase
VRTALTAQHRPGNSSPVKRLLSGPLGGHYWTLLPFLQQRVWQAAAAHPVPRATPWSLQVSDAEFGSVRLTGLLYAPVGAERLVLLVHGLGGSAESTYLAPAVARAHALGIACLCLNLRGADGQGEDFYHAALTSDLHAALGSAELAQYRSLHVLGFSLGGHLALRMATEQHDPRLRSIAAICAPLDLGRSQRALDQGYRMPYRAYVLGRLKASYAEVAKRRPVPNPVERVLRVRRLREWDELTVVPRFGFGSASEYYARASVGPLLGTLRVPALLVLTEQDPMVPASTLRPALEGAAPLLEVRWLGRGGHVGFPSGIDLGEPVPLGLEPQVLSWLERAA